MIKKLFVIAFAFGCISSLSAIDPNPIEKGKSTTESLLESKKEVEQKEAEKKDVEKKDIEKKEVETKKEAPSTSTTATPSCIANCNEKYTVCQQAESEKDFPQYSKCFRAHVSCKAVCH